MLTTRISPYTIGGITGKALRQPARAAQDAGTNEEIPLYSTIRHTPLSHCPLPVGHTTCIALYSMRVNYMYNAPQRITQKQTTRSHAKSIKRRRRSMRPKENYIYIYFLLFSFSFSEFFAPGEKISHAGRKNLPRGENFAPPPSFSY